jgi:molybdopterin molybdotransferase
MQEKVKVVSGRLMLPEEVIHKGEHVRLPGSEIASGTVVIEKGTIISPAAAGILASVGAINAKVYPRPKVGILVTGSELQKPGQTLEKGQIYESNSYTLLAALHQLHIDGVLAYAKDDPEEMESQIRTILQQCDLLLITGGVSVGTYDYTCQALEKCGVSLVFHKVRQKPGKPLLFGMKEKIPVFGLPGNPGSVLTCFYEYVIPAIERLTLQKCILKALDSPLSHDISKPRALTCFFKGYFDGKTATVLSGQESFKMASYNQANCLIMVPEEIEGCAVRDLVKIHLIPGTHHP